MPLILAAALLCSCSNDSEDAPEKGSIKAMTEEIGHEAAQMIQAPIDKANFTVDQENKRMEELEERLNNASE